MMRKTTSSVYRAWTPRLFFALLLLCVLTPGAPAQNLRELPSPAGEGSGQSNLTVDRGGRVYLSWIDRLENKRFALRFSTLGARGWSASQTIAEGDNWFVNWADFPSLAVLPDGSLAAHWLAKSGTGAYAYDVNIARSFNGGKTWSAPIVPHRDGMPTEHGFVSMFPAQGGALAAVWLDGREMKQGDSTHDGHGHGSMTLRYAVIGRGARLDAESLVDARVCECCQTSAAMTAEGPVVVYRDRSEQEIRDIAIIRLRDGRWSEPQIVHADNWKIDGCPVNGPSVAAAGRRVAVAWFTMAGDAPHVRVALSVDAGASFPRVVEVGDGDPVGRVDVSLLEDGSAIVTWIEKTKAGAEVRLRRVGPDGTRYASITVAPSGAARSSGFPQMARTGDRLILSWTGQRGVQTAELRLKSLSSIATSR